MALAIPLFLMHILGAGGTLLGANAFRRKAEEEHEGKQTVIKMAQESAMKTAGMGQEVNPEVLKLAFGSNAAKVAPFLAMFSNASRVRQQQNWQRFQEFAGNAGAFGSPSAGGVEPLTPGQAAVLPQGALDPRALPPGYGVPPRPGMGAPAPRGTPGFNPPTIGGNAPVSAESDLLPTPKPGVMAQGQARPAPPTIVPQGGIPGLPVLGAAQPHKTMSMDENGNARFTVTMPTDTEVRAGVKAGAMRILKPGVNSLYELLDAAAAHGFEVTKDQAEAYGRQDWLRLQGEYLDKVTEGKASKNKIFISNQTMRRAAVAFGYDRGYTPAKEIQELWENKDDEDNFFLTSAMKPDPQNPNDLHRWIKDRTVPEIVSVFNQYGVFPTDKAVQQLYAQKRAYVERFLDTNIPALQQYPEARLHEIRKRVGAGALNDQERQAVDRPADLTDRQKQGYLAPPGGRVGRLPLAREMAAEAGIVVPGPPSQIQVPEVNLPQPIPQGAQQQGEAIEERQREAAAAAGVRGTGRGKEEVRPEETIPPEKLNQYRNPDTLRVPPAGTKIGQAEAKGGEYTAFLGTTEHANQIGRLRKAEAMVEDSLNLLRPYMAQGALATKARTLGLTGLKIKVPIFGELHIPAGSLPDAQAIKKAFPNETPERGRLLAEAVIRLNAMGDEAASILRSEAFGEKGNTAAYLVTQQGHALANLNNSALTAAQKFRDFRSQVRSFEETFNVHRSPKYDPKYYLKLGESSAPSSGKMIEVWDPATGTVKKVPAP